VASKRITVRIVADTRAWRPLQPCPVCERPRRLHDPKCPPKVERRLARQDQFEDAKWELRKALWWPIEQRMQPVVSWLAASVWHQVVWWLGIMATLAGLWVLDNAI